MENHVISELAQRKQRTAQHITGTQNNRKIINK